MDWKKSQWLRTIRRFAAVFIISGISFIGVQKTITLEQIAICFVIGGLAGLDKYIREKYSISPLQTPQETPQPKPKY